MLLPDERVVLHASSPDDASRAGQALAAVGFLELGGYLVGVETPERLEPLEVDELELLLAGDEIELVDVREQAERDDGYIPGSRNIPYRLLRRCSDELRGEHPSEREDLRDRRSRLDRGQHPRRLRDRGGPVLNGGIATWQARGNAIVTFRRCGSG